VDGPPRAHGTYGRYLLHGCRCTPCSKANDRYADAVAERRMAGAASRRRPTPTVPAHGTLQLTFPAAPALPAGWQKIVDG
jgi:hypothetical protein